MTFSLHERWRADSQGNIAMVTYIVYTKLGRILELYASTLKFIHSRLQSDNTERSTKR